MDNASNNIAIRAEGVRKEFPMPREPLVVLSGVDLSVQRGESVVIMGPSGSGKSTLLQILGSLDAPTAGKVRLLDQDPFGLSTGRLAEFRNRHIGFVFQEHQLLPQCSVLENVLVPTLVNPGDREEAAERAKWLLERLGLEKRIEYRPADLSGGERQRVAIARALIRAPEILLCDEPTGSVDEKTGDSIGEYFRSLLGEEKTALVIVTHNARFAEGFERTHHLREGKLE